MGIGVESGGASVVMCAWIVKTDTGAWGCARGGRGPEFGAGWDPRRNIASRDFPEV